MFSFYLLIIIISQYSSQNIINISNFKNVTIPSKERICDYILSYSLIGSKNFPYAKLIIRRFEIINFYIYNSQYLYAYHNLDLLLKDKEKKDFSNSVFHRQFGGSDTIYEKDVDNYKDKTYYFIFENSGNDYYFKYNFSIIIYSTVSNFTISQPISFSGKKSNYLFYISYEHKKYSHFGLKKITNDISCKIEIFDGKNYNQLYQRDSNDYFEDYYELQEKYRYFINLTLTSSSQNNGDFNKIYFYLLQTDNNNPIISLDESENFQEFPVLKELNLLLHVTIQRYYKLYIEYNWEYSLEDSIKVYGYSDKNIISSTSGEEIKLIKDDDCVYEKRICKAFIRKKEKDLNYLILKISSLKKNYNDSYAINIRYGKSEEYAQDNIVASTGMGLGLSAPNIILHILNAVIWKRKHLTFAFLILDLMFLLGFSDLISLYIYIGTEQSFYCGIVLLSLYGIVFIIFYLYQIKGKKNGTPSGFVYFLKLLSLPIIEEAISQNKRLQPCLKIKARSFHQESREICNKYKNVDIYGDAEYYYEKEEKGKDLVLKERLPFLGTEERHAETTYSEWSRVDRGGGKFKEKFVPNDKYRYVITNEEREVETWNKETEFKYTSWQDNTNFITNYNYSVLVANFKIEFDLYDDTKNDIENLKTQMNQEANTHDTETEITEIFTVPGLKERVPCLPKDNFTNNILFLCIAFILTIFGFSSFVNFFIYYEEKEVDITLIKSIASSNRYENPFMEQTSFEDNINISGEKGTKTKAGQIYEPLMA